MVVQIVYTCINFRKYSKAYALEREICDLQSEFQLDRSDYLETIRKLEKNVKFYQQLIELSLPYLRKSGRLWDPEAIKRDSIWNEDLNKWKLPEDSMSRLRLPPAGNYIFTKIPNLAHLI